MGGQFLGGLTAEVGGWGLTAEVGARGANRRGGGLTAQEIKIGPIVSRFQGPSASNGMFLTGHRGFGLQKAS